MAILLQVCGWLGVFFFAFAIYVVAEACYYQGRLGPALQRDLGFREGATYIRVGRLPQSAVSVLEVAPGGAFEQAGFRSGDVLPDVSHSSLFKALHRHRGGVAELAVVDGGDGPPFGERPWRVLRIAVPQRGK